MNIRAAIGDTLRTGLYGKAERGLDRPPLYGAQQQMYTTVVNLDDTRTTERKALSSVYFYSNIRVLAQKVGAPDLHVLKRVGETKEPLYDHPFEQLIRRPNPLMSRSDLMDFSTWWLYLKGDAYWYLTTVGSELMEMWPLPANEVDAVPHKTDIISHYEWKPGGRKLPPIPVEKIAHFRMTNPLSVINGMSAIDALRYAIEGSDARFRWELEFFNKGYAVPEGLLSVDPQTTKEDVARIKEELKNRYGDGSRGIAVGKAGQMSFERFTLTQEEMAFLDRLQYDEKLFDRVFGFPGGYWDAKANRANAEQAERSLARDTVEPLLGKFAGNIETQILDRYYEDTDDLTCEFDSVVPDDREQAVAEFREYSQVMTYDEARSQIGLPPVEGDLGVTPFALIPALGQMIASGFQEMPMVEVKSNGATKDLRNWQQVALKAISKGREPREFHSDLIPYHVQDEIVTALAGADDADTVKAAFRPWLNNGVREWYDYP